MNEKHFYHFGEFQIEAGERLLFRNGEVVQLTQKAFDVLFVLVERSGRIVTKEELMTEVWPDAFVEEGNLSQNIYTLRKLLGETSTGDDYIKTVPRRGYRFAAPVTETWEGDRAEIPTGELRRLVDLKKEKLTDLIRPADESSITKESPSKPISQLNRRNKAIVVAALALLVLGSAGWAVYRLTRPTEPFSKINISSLTTAGNVQCVATSPDGKFVVYAVSDRPQLSSLLVMQLSTSTTQTIIPADEVHYRAVTVSPDSSYVYAVRKRNDVPGFALYRVPLLGGTPVKLIEQVETAVGFSPDGKRMAFRRSLNARREAVLLVANADGTGEREIASINFPDSFYEPAWSPDGSVIVSAIGSAHGGINMDVAAIEVGDGSGAGDRKMRMLLREKWKWIRNIEWLPDSSGLVMVGNRIASDPIQIWRLDYSSGETKRITSDSNSYNRLSMSADARLIAALQLKLATNVWMAPAEDPAKAKQISIGTGGYFGKLSWTSDDRVVFDSEAGSASAISIMNADGSNQKRLSGEPNAEPIIGHATATPDGRYIVYYSDQAGARNIWRMNSDGSNPVQLTRGEGEDQPDCSPDSKWVVFTKQERGGSLRPTLWKVPIDGGQPVQLSREYTTSPSVSPDGKLLACSYSPSLESAGQPALFGFDGSGLVKTFPQKIDNSSHIRWTHDGRGLIYSENPVGTSKLWLQPIEGGQPRVLLELETDRIFGFDLSRDGKRIALVRGLWSQNVVIVRSL